MAVPIESPLFWLAAIVGVMLTGISKSGFAGGAGVVAVPLLTFFISVPQATAMVLPLLLTMDVRTIQYYRQHIDKPVLKALMPSALAGIVLGGLLLGLFPGDVLQLLLGVLSMVFACWGQLVPFFKRLKGAGLIWGGVAGLTSTLIHSGGPPLHMYLLSQQLPKHTWLATTGVMFGFMNLVKIIPYSIVTPWNTSLAMVALALIPVALISIKMGYWLQGFLSEKLFISLCRSCLFITGLMLVIKSLIE